MFLILWRKYHDTDVLNHLSLEVDYLFQVTFSPKLENLVGESGTAQTGRALDPMGLIGEVVDLAMKA